MNAILEALKKQLENVDENDALVSEVVELASSSNCVIRGVAQYIIETVQSGWGFDHCYGKGVDPVGDNVIGDSVREIAELIGAEYNTDLIARIRHLRMSARLDSIRRSELHRENYRLRGEVEFVRKHNQQLKAELEALKVGVAQ